MAACRKPCQSSSQGSGCTRALPLPKQGPFRQRTMVPRRQECTSGNRPDFKIQDSDLNNWGTNCHAICQPIWTGEMSTRLTCYVSNTTGCTVGFSQSGVAQQRLRRDTAPYLGHHCWLVGDHQRAKSLLFLEHKKKTKTIKYLCSFQGMLLCLCLS